MLFFVHQLCIRGRLQGIFFFTPHPEHGENNLDVVAGLAKLLDGFGTNKGNRSRFKDPNDYNVRKLHSVDNSRKYLGLVACKDRVSQIELGQIDQE